MSEVAVDQRESSPLAETPDVCGAYPRLSDDQISTLDAGGTRRTVSQGEMLVREGERADDFFVILSGKVAVSTLDDAGNQRVMRVHGPGRFLGELGDLEGEAPASRPASESARRSGQHEGPGLISAARGGGHRAVAADPGAAR